MKLPFDKIFRKMDKKLLPIVILGLFGFLLFALSGLTQGSDTDKGAVSDDVSAQTELKEKTQAELEQLLESMDGISKAKVYISFDSMEAYEYAENEETGTGGASKNYVLRNDGNTESGLIVCIRCPEIRGVAAVCDYSGSAVIKEEIVSLLSSALGVPAGKIYVSRMASK